METGIAGVAYGETALIPILPMRHGNFCSGTITFEFTPYSDPTYEAWKQTTFDQAMQFIFSIPILPMRHGNPMIPSGQGGPLRIPILPMRHGNLCTPIILAFPTS